MKHIIITLLVLLFGATTKAQQLPERLIVLTDIENEPDDSESTVRLLLYTNEIDVRGIVATTSTHMRNRIWPESLHKIISAYGKVRDNLLLHDKRYPTEESLHAKVKRGQPAYGMAAIGKGKSTEGSQLIIDELKASERPLWVTEWGGANTLAQALFDLKRECKSEKELEALVSRLRVYTISDQDDSGAWMRKNFPTLFYIVSPGGYGNATWSGMMAAEKGSNKSLISNQWIAKNIQQGHGPLGACYPDVAYGIEGDTPSWLALIPNGLNVPEHPEYGGWGGRYKLYIPEYETLDLNGFTGGVPIERETRPIWTNAIDSFYTYRAPYNGAAIERSKKKVGGYKATVWRWRKGVQNDFAARMDWTVKPVQEANHAPIVKLNHPDILTVKSGETFTLEAQDSYDPDGDNLSFLWYNYPEAGTYGEEIFPFGMPNIAHVAVPAPKVKEKTQLHFIVEVTDKGTPQMTSYKRVIVNVTPPRE